LRTFHKSLQWEGNDPDLTRKQDVRQESMKKIRAMIRLFRLELPLAAGVCVILGEILGAGKVPAFLVSFFGFLAVFFISSSANILNDYFDLETDRVNAPDRPLPSGLVSPQEVILLGAFTALLGLTAAALVNLPALLVGGLFWCIGFLYNWKMKATGLPGNLLVSSCVAGMFLFGGVSVSAPWNPVVWSFGLMVFFFDLGEEIASGAMDEEGDRKRGGRSIAILKGRQAALNLASLMFAISILIGLIPYLMGWLGVPYLVMILSMGGIITFFTVKLLRSRSEQGGRACLRWNYLGASLCLLAFLIGRVAG
jgi:geranylgeranylglycerol-phosphate geranylgeranyltransferase